MSDNIILDTKLAGEISGDFFVPSYQRGYRWGTEEVTRLLEDIYQNGDRPYCLQPVVVRRTGDRFELIDGQQRLTTLYLIYMFIHQVNDFYDEPKFSLSYETRTRSKEFLENIDLSLRNDNIDFYFMANAFESIKAWFAGKKKSVLNHIYNYLDENVKVIWYEVGSDEDPVALFTRLNIGKIPLTSAELIKAMFLCGESESVMAHERQEEISLQWDNMERELHNNRFWYFLTNAAGNRYQTRIDVVLDLMAGKPADTKDTYYTYFRFDEMRSQSSLERVWQDIQQTFLQLKDWFENHELYHKIGYLIASGAKNLQEIFDFSVGKTKTEFLDGLSFFIKKSVAIGRNYAELSYEVPTDYRNISRLLLLFNVESVRLNGEQTQWFPFDKFKFGSGGKVAWSLEHIHAQQSEGLRTQEMWKEWLALHIPSVRAVSDDPEELVGQMQKAIDKERLDRAEFDTLQQQVIALLSVQGNAEYLHSISNLALLSADDNAALNNSTFDVKRNRIMEMDKSGQYIPFCTKMVFLKYYTPSGESQLHFWGNADREAYVEAMNTVLAQYLEEPVSLVKEGKE
jgi:hypothetical protein